VEKTATISECGLYRYDLTRRWADGGTTCAFVGLNPSTADAELDDPTIIRCIGFARDWGHSQLVMLNAYAYRATKPKDMRKAADPIGPLNDNDYLLPWFNSCKVVIAAWGANIDSDRQKHLIKLFQWMSVLRLTKGGNPGHPLYLPKTLKPVEWVR